MRSDLDRTRRWRLRQSWWIGPIALGFGALTWVGFAYVGMRTKRRRWVAWALLYFALLTVSLYWLGLPGYGWHASLGTVGLLGCCWIGGFVHALVIRDHALDALSVYTDPRLKLAQRQLRRRGTAGRIAAANPALAREAGIGADARAFGGVVDVNQANAEALALLPGIPVDLAHRIVDIRERIGGFDSVLDFATILGLPPSVTDRIRNRLICLPR